MQIGQAPVQTGPEARQNFPSELPKVRVSPSMFTVGFFSVISSPIFILPTLFSPTLCFSLYPFVFRSALLDTEVLATTGCLPPFLWRVLLKVTFLSLALAAFLLEIHSLALVDAHQ